MSVTWWSVFQSFDYERHLMKFIPIFWLWAYLIKFIPTFWLWAYLMKFIPIFWLWASPDEVYSNLLTMSVTWLSLFQSFDYERHLMKFIPIFWLWASPDEVYSNLLTMSVTWWSLFQSFDYERHLMKVIPEKSCARVISRFYFSRHVHRIIIEISLVSKAKFLKLIRHRKF